MVQLTVPLYYNIVDIIIVCINLVVIIERGFILNQIMRLFKQMNNVFEFFLSFSRQFLYLPNFQKKTRKHSLIYLHNSRLQIFIAHLCLYIITINYNDILYTFDVILIGCNSCSKHSLL